MMELSRQQDEQQQTIIAKLSTMENKPELQDSENLYSSVFVSKVKTENKINLKS